MFVSDLVTMFIIVLIFLGSRSCLTSISTWLGMPIEVLSVSRPQTLILFQYLQTLSAYLHSVFHRMMPSDKYNIFLRLSTNF